MRRFHVHLVENFSDLHHHFLIAESDDRVCALIGDDLCIADRDCFRRRVHRLRLQFFGNVQRAAAGAAAAAVATRRCRCCCGNAARGRSCGGRPFSRTRRRTRRGWLFGAGTSGLPGLTQSLHDHRQYVRRGNVSQRPRDGFREFNVRVELGNQFANKWHVNRTRDHVDTVRAFVRFEFDFPDNHRFLGERGESGKLGHFAGRGRRHRHVRCSDGPNSAVPARLTMYPRLRLGVFKNVL